METNASDERVCGETDVLAGGDKDSEMRADIAALLLF